MTTWAVDALGRATATVRNDTAGLYPSSSTADNDVTFLFRSNR